MALLRSVPESLSRRTLCSLVVVATAVLSVCSLYAAPQILWLEKDYKFGLMMEEDGPRTGLSKFVNMGKKPITLLQVKPSCGCTSATYPEEPIAPGDTAVITYTYDPAGRPGRFEKSVRVTFDDNSKEIIRISGNVLGTDSSLRLFYPVEVGPLRLTEDIIPYGETRFGALANRFITGYNALTDSIRPRVEYTSDALIVVPSDSVVGPGDLVTFAVSLDTRRAETVGPLEIPFTVFADASPNTASHTVTVRADVMPDMTRINDPQSAPLCFVAPAVVDLGIISGKKAIKAYFTITNQGKSPLRLTRLFSDSPALHTGKLPSELRPGKSTRIELSIDPTRLNQDNSDSALPIRIPVKLYSSDPYHPVSTITVVGECDRQ